MKEIKKQVPETGTEIRSRKETARKAYLKAKDKTLDDEVMKRYVPVEIYLDTDDPAALETVNEAVRNVLDEMDLETFSNPEIFKGSIIEKFWAATKSVVTNLDLLKKIADFVGSFKKNQSSSSPDKLFSKKEPSVQLSETLKYLKEVPNISVRVGSLLITKSTTRDIPLIQVKNLAREEVILLDQNPGILRNPKTLHTRLNTLKREKFFSSNMAMNL